MEMEADGPSSEKRMRVDEDEGGGADRISDLSDAVLGEIISLLPTKDGARTRILASRWRHIWCSAPLNLDCRGLARCGELAAGVISHILASHQGPGRRFCIRHGFRGYRADTVDSWLRSPALDNLEEFNLHCPRQHQVMLPVLSEPFFRFSKTLIVATIERCHLSDNTVQGLQFLQLKQLSLEMVTISECSLQRIIAGCPALECLLISYCSGFRSITINSVSLRSIGVRAECRWACERKFEKLIIENAPSLEKLLHLDWSSGLDMSVVFAPKLETLRCSSETYNIILLGSTVIESFETGPNNLWRRKHQNLVRCHDIRLKKIVLEQYYGVMSQVSFVTFFVLHAKVLESMTLGIEAKNSNEEFFAKHRKKLQLEKRASRGARFKFTTGKCFRNVWDIKDFDDLDLADPFTC
ncbi:F-box protein At5g03100-like isoform X2 [Lolium rigidum]|uniref:F-box protein At5g03100-like isoform X2 n=1 Tax=Lolium rigidum TaxID=89674 RepID=UPI001F5D5491|nr:F-box protein At5g03100-like isoform X2 [Lolium rigidum]